MIIDVKALRFKGIDKQNFSFSYEPPTDVLTVFGGSFSSPVRIEVCADVYKEEVFLDGTVEYEISAPCARCLDKASYHGKIEFDERFLPKYREAEAEDAVTVYDRDRIDITPFINELLTTDMPLTVLCSDDCKGICPDCGKNLNDGDCGCDRRNN